MAVNDLRNRAITAHLMRKVRLRTALEGGDVPTSARRGSTIRASSGSGSGPRPPACTSRPGSRPCQQKHAILHRVAADVLRAIRAGDAKKAAGALDGGPFLRASNDVIGAIQELKKQRDMA